MERIEEMVEALERRAFLYDDPESFKAGVLETVRALGSAPIEELDTVSA
jgi:hypothetical protein